MMIRKPMTEEGALRKLAALCAKGEHSSGEMDQKLRRWGLDGEARQRVIARLTDRHFVDDSRFARAFVADKIHYDHWGRRKIEQGLRLKGVDAATAAAALDAVEPEEYVSVLRPLMRSKWSTIKAESDYERSAKLIKWAMGRGFTLDIIRQCVDQATEAADAFDDE